VARCEVLRYVSEIQSGRDEHYTVHWYYEIYLVVVVVVVVVVSSSSSSSSSSSRRTKLLANPLTEVRYIAIF
jgi:hypothetical protein